MQRLILCAMGALLMMGPRAEAGFWTSRNEVKLTRVSASVDEQACQPDGDRTIIERIRREFHVSEGVIQYLHEQRNLGYGEIVILFSLADRLPGGATRENVDKILAMREGSPKMGWGRIAHQLGEKLGPVLADVEDIGRCDRPDKPERGEKVEGAGHKDRAERAERGHRAERAERAERRERGERPEKAKR
jgi:hypothetical protein